MGMLAMARKTAIERLVSESEQPVSLIVLPAGNTDTFVASVMAPRLGAATQAMRCHRRVVATPPQEPSRRHPKGGWLF